MVFLHCKTLVAKAFFNVKGCSVNIKNILIIAYICVNYCVHIPQCNLNLISSRVELRMHLPPNFCQRTCGCHCCIAYGDTFMSDFCLLFS